MAAAVACDSRGRAYVGVRNIPPGGGVGGILPGEGRVVVLNPDGSLHGDWDFKFSSPHAVWVSDQDEVFVADTGLHTVTRHAPSGEVLLMLGTPSEPGPPGAPFNMPTGAVQAIKSSPGVTALGTVTEVDIYRLAQQSNGQLTVDPNAYNRYRLDGSSISVTWPPSSRNVRNGSSDYLGVTIYYQYQWQSGQVLGATALQLSQTFDARIEPQRY